MAESAVAFGVRCAAKLAAADMKRVLDPVALVEFGREKIGDQLIGGHGVVA